jgi:putative lipoic acid-binding regulatory protein
MDETDSLSLLNATHSFPCSVMIKVIGVSRDAFVTEVVQAVRMAVGPEPTVPFTCRQTPAGRHTAVTLEPHVSSAEQVLEIYRQVRQVSGIILTL